MNSFSKLLGLFFKIYISYHASLLSSVVDNEQIEAYMPNDYMDHLETNKG